MLITTKQSIRLNHLGYNCIDTIYFLLSLLELFLCTYCSLDFLSTNTWWIFTIAKYSIDFGSLSLRLMSNIWSTTIYLTYKPNLNSSRSYCLNMIAPTYCTNLKAPTFFIFYLVIQVSELISLSFIRLILEVGSLSPDLPTE